MQHLASKQLIVKIIDEGNDMLVWAKAVPAFPGIVCGLRYVKGKRDLFLGYALSLPCLKEGRREIIQDIHFAPPFR